MQVTDKLRGWVPHPEEVIFPLAVLLHNAGIDKEEALSLFRLALEAAPKYQEQDKLFSLPNAPLLRDVVATWVGDPRFLTSAGRPRILRLRGPHSFEALVRAATSNADCGNILAQLVEIENVEVLRNDRVKLRTRFLMVRKPGALAYEPTLRFLADVCSAAGTSLRTDDACSIPHNYWRLLEADGLPATVVKEFRKISSARSLQLLEELDAWLSTRKKQAGVPSNGGQRVSIGVFVHGEPGEGE
jgi:hypothetical protein